MFLAPYFVGLHVVGVIDVVLTVGAGVKGGPVGVDVVGDLDVLADEESHYQSDIAVDVITTCHTPFFGSINHNECLRTCSALALGLADHTRVAMAATCGVALEGLAVITVTVGRHSAENLHARRGNINLTVPLQEAGKKYFIGVNSSN